MKRFIEIWDTTLREGEQTPGVIFKPEQKIEFAYKLSEYGIDKIAIMAESSKTDQEIAKKLSNDPAVADITALTRMKKESIDIALECGVQQVKLFTPLSDIQMKTKFGIDRKENIERTLSCIEYAREQGAKGISMGTEDCSRADINYIIEFLEAITGKVDYFYYTDTVGDLIPSEVTYIISKIKKHFPGKIILHMHNDRGLSTANSLAGIAAGAHAVSGSFTGIGERTGNAPLEEVIKTLKDKYNVEVGFDTYRIREICQLVQQYSGIYVQPHKPMCGKNVFTHKAGIHFSAIIQNPENYELFPPQEIGEERSFVYGKHSGVSNLRYLFRDKFTDSEYRYMLEYLKEQSQAQKKDFDEFEVRLLLEDFSA